MCGNIYNSRSFYLGKKPIRYMVYILVTNNTSFKVTHTQHTFQWLPVKYLFGLQEAPPRWQLSMKRGWRAQESVGVAGGAVGGAVGGPGDGIVGGAETAVPALISAVVGRICGVRWQNSKQFNMPASAIKSSGKSLWSTTTSGISVARLIGRKTLNGFPRKHHQLQ